jgi:cytochrome c551/c552
MISWRKHYRQTLIAIGLLLSTSASIYGQDGDPKNGEKLFKANCTACHALDKQLVGPPWRSSRTSKERTKSRHRLVSKVDKDNKNLELLETSMPMKFLKNLTRLRCRSFQIFQIRILTTS